MSKTKRMIYVREENLEFYDSLENKSDFINEALKLARLGGVENLKVTEVEEGEVPSNGTAGVHEAVETMRERDARILSEYRAKHGLYDPTRTE